LEPHPEILDELGLTAKQAKEMSISQGKGCVECNNTGYKGRQGLFEVMPVSPTIRDMILDRAATSEIKKMAVKEGMLTLRAHGLLKLGEGLTSVEEILKETSDDE
jgi:type IV pilus assembly protein PilB